LVDTPTPAIFFLLSFADRFFHSAFQRQRMISLDPDDVGFDLPVQPELAERMVAEGQPARLVAGII
jgi:hypothetical protein